MEMVKYNRILVATDYSSLSGNAIKTAAVLCQKHKATMILLHVVKDAPEFYPEVDYNPSQNYVEEMKIAARSALRHLGDRIREEYSIPVDEIVAYGVVISQIVMTIHKEDPDLVVMGTHGTSGFRSFFIGSTAYRVIKHTKHPVMTVPGTGDWTTFRNVLFPLRMIPDALKKYDHVRPILLKDRPVLHILGLSMETDPGSAKSMSELEEALSLKLEEDKISFSVSFHHCKNYAEKILEMVPEHKADLVVIIATIDKTKGEFFIGPFSQQVLNHATVPVLCVRT